MTRAWIAVAALASIAFCHSVEAAGTVNPKTAEWNAPLTNTDTSPLIDLAGYNIYVATAPTPPTFPGPGWTKVVTVLAPSPAPSPGTKGTWTLAGIPGSAGQKHMIVTAVDITGVESDGSASVPFVLKAPGVPTNLILKP